MPPAPLTAQLDHVAVAVADLDAAAARWHEMGAVPVMGSRGAAFSNEQVRFSCGGKVELIAPGRDASFMTAYLDRFGPGRIHHLTLKLRHSLAEGVQRLAQAGVPVVDVSDDDPVWHEAFLGPRTVGGVIVQIADAALSDAEFAAATGRPAPAPVDPTAPRLDRVVLGHHDLAASARLWTTLGATVRPLDEESMLATYPDSATAIELRGSSSAGPLGLRLQEVDGYAAARPGAGTPYRPALLPPTNQATV
ncbi:VOC family protein [Euzebya tangerina]|uniref:VOC family protein n=1 Tax=Euzebya tangerina TaxID=591198 RepID=UPI000E3127AF|nr:VOC family protein [Euzebya tangerina]